MLGQRVGTAVAEARQGIARRLWLHRESMPGELSTGTLVLSEVDLRTTYPVPLRGRPDQVYNSARGLLVPVDTKRRGAVAVFDADVVQLSVYATILAFTDDHRLPHHRVAGYGYIRLVMPTIQYVRVPLLSAEEVVSVWMMHWGRRQGT